MTAHANTTKITGLAMLCSCLFFGLFAHVSALTISPAKVEITGDPGTTVYGEIELFNEQEGARTFFSSVENFEPSGDSGAPRFVGGAEGLASWIQAKDSVSIAPGEYVTVPFSITIPAGTEPGGYFSAIFWGSQPVASQGAGEVSIGGKIGVLVLLRVSGEVEEGGGILDFGAVDGARLVTQLPVTFSYRINNSGGDRIVPLGTIAIKNNVRYTTDTLNANKNEGSVLPSSTRKFEATWGEQPKQGEAQQTTGFFATAVQQASDFHFGWYTAELQLVWGTSNTTGTETYHFFVFPWQLLSIVLVVLVFVVYGGKKILTKYNAFIIKKARHTNV